ncbi:hypothetical protein MGYG_07671 [Nannizzia gypsea CBS 118893]|uniref:Uncharacterized protein n=1 Tax=Arthroderma gypseum (strain ATCC MYA-4604 / CBS 118893) TaxID=535722 RepID=E4V3U2_ARTGP|nr:hypothetical protein MGYG_07671 [Nannizzia gypsea CBS 118893]EFR04666.1 hypothetical protein MGYG_07671 [Nannizzia gypsea CBS 118893]
MYDGDGDDAAVADRIGSAYRLHIDARSAEMPMAPSSVVRPYPEHSEAAKSTRFYIRSKYGLRIEREGRLKGDRQGGRRTGQRSRQTASLAQVALLRGSPGGWLHGATSRGWVQLVTHTPAEGPDQDAGTENLIGGLTGDFVFSGIQEKRRKKKKVIKKGTPQAVFKVHMYDD